MARFEICWFSLGGGGAKLTFADSRQVGSHLRLGEQVIQIIKHQQVVGIIIIAMLLMMLLQIMMMMTNCWLFYKSKFVQDTEWADSITGALSAIIVNLFEVQLKIKAIYIYYLAVHLLLSLKKGKRSNQLWESCEAFINRFNSYVVSIKSRFDMGKLSIMHQPWEDPFVFIGLVIHQRIHPCWSFSFVNHTWPIHGEVSKLQ